VRVAVKLLFFQPNDQALFILIIFYFLFFASPCVLIARTWQLESSRHDLPSNRGQETNPLAQV
jgi:hypothetical protein